jgi:CMP-N,N'-diacetyllegionaminic acid synthase
MLKGKSFLAIIPARGGSKRLPNKNIIDLCGKPLIAWTIEAGLKSKYIDTLIVSSDSDEILSIAKSFGARIIKRPDELATDTASSFDVVRHVIENTKKHDYIVLLQPTSPLREARHIDESIEMLLEKNANAVISLCEMEHSPLWSNTIGDDMSLKNFIKDDIKNKRSQDLPTYYRINGAIYICSTAELLKQQTFMLEDNIFGYIMDKDTSVDIDENLDFLLAKTIMENR